MWLSFIATYVKKSGHRMRWAMNYERKWHRIEKKLEADSGFHPIELITVSVCFIDT
jgi:hypothetical protein